MADRDVVLPRRGHSFRAKSRTERSPLLDGLKAGRSGSTPPCCLHCHALDHALGSCTVPPHRGQVDGYLMTTDSYSLRRSRQVPLLSVVLLSVPGLVLARGGDRDTGQVAVHRIPCVGAVLKDEAGPLLLIKRGH